jgi:predicted transcriptional regulator
LNSSSITLLKILKDGVSDKKEVMRILEVHEWQLHALVKDLINRDYIEQNNSTITFRENTKAILFRDIAAQYDAVKLLHGSNEKVFFNIAEPITVDNLHKLSGLSIPTIYKSLTEFESIGIIKRDQDTIHIDKSNEKLYLFAKILKTESERKNIEPYAEIIYQDSLRVLKKVPKGRVVEGELTAFSLFSDYGIDYRVVHDYYIKQESALKLEDVLIHAVLAASKLKDKKANAVSILFYLQNRDKMNLMDLRSTARIYGIFSTWLDIEAYVRNDNNAIKNRELFLPPDEFEEIGVLYNISSDLYSLPNAYPNLFQEIGDNLTSNLEVYLFGGENMRLKKLKDSTKDCDIVVSDDKSYDILVVALKKMGYKSKEESSLTPEEIRISASDILVHTTRSNIDIFNKIIARKLVLSEGMKNRARTDNFGKLTLGILENEDVFLLKGVTSREGDIQDMGRIVQRGNRFNWDIVLNELIEQESISLTLTDYSDIFLESITSLYEATGIRAPFYRQLLRRVTDEKIKSLVRQRDVPLNEVVYQLEGGDVTEILVRNRVGQLVKKKYLEKIQKGKQIVLHGLDKLRLTMNPKVMVSIRESILQHIQDLSTKLHLSPEFVRNAIEAAETISRSHDMEAHKPNAVAAAILLLIAQRYRMRHAAKLIAQAGDVNQTMLYYLTKDVKKTLAKKMY